MRQSSVRPYASLVLVLVVALAVGWGLINRYSVAPQDQSYVEPARRFLGAAVTADSAQLTQLAVPRVVAWALETNAPLAITFEGPPSKARLVALSADCEPRR
jgi:hypothetical protein